MSKLGFVIEYRSGVPVVQFDSGGCVPASFVEETLWKALQESEQNR